MKRINWKRISFVLLLSLITFISAGIVWWMQGTLGPSATALEALQSDEQVLVWQEPSFTVFKPVDDTPSTGFVLYPGARVDPRSYAPILRQIATHGYLAVVLNMPLHFAVLDSDAADFRLVAFPDIEHWVIGGHSLGGVVAASYAGTHTNVEAVVLLAAYPGDDVLKDAGIPTLSIYGSRDGLTTVAKIEGSRPLLPSDTVFLEIEGGNHSQFGSYGLQDGDHEASIAPEEQRSQMVEAIVDLLSSIAR